jgi:hypothetical protein
VDFVDAERGGDGAGGVRIVAAEHDIADVYGEEALIRSASREMGALPDWMERERSIRAARAARVMP